MTSDGESGAFVEIGSKHANTGKRVIPRNFCLSAPPRGMVASKSHNDDDVEHADCLSVHTGYSSSLCGVDCDARRGPSGIASVLSG